MIRAYSFAAALVLTCACATETTSERLIAPPAGGGCLAANPNDTIPDDQQLQACLQRGGTIRLAAGTPGYIIAKGIKLVHHGTVLTSMPGPTKATLVAHPDLNQVMLESINLNNIVISRLRIDGNKAVRTVVCKEYRRYGSNVHLENGSGYKVHHLEVINAHCGTALGVNGDNFDVHHNVLRDNGKHGAPCTNNPYSTDPEPWADGITSGKCNHGRIHDNYVEDSTDIGIVVGGGPGCVVENNTIEQVGSHAYAGIAVHHFAAEGAGNHAGSIFRNNTVNCGLDMCDFGISVGHHPWSDSLHVSGARIEDNSISGAVINLAVDGFSDGTVRRNSLSNPRGNGVFCTGACGYTGNYTVAHTADSCLQRGWEDMILHDGQCQPTVKKECVPWGRPKQPIGDCGSCD